jgi:two-component system nitrogen regulation sensor histidine kinase NtrY
VPGNAAEGGEGRVDVVLAYHAGQWCIDVSDTGKGFPADNRQRLLEPYMTTREGGTGLGLAIVAKIFEDHGGRIELLDRADGQRGATVHLWLPGSGADAVPDQQMETPQPKAGAGHETAHST